MTTPTAEIRRVLQGIVDSTVHPDAAVRALLVPLEPVRNALALVDALEQALIEEVRQHSDLKAKVRLYLSESSIDGRAIRQSMREELGRLCA